VTKNCNMQSLGPVKLSCVSSPLYGFVVNNSDLGLRAHRARCAFATQPVAYTICGSGEPHICHATFQSPRRRLQHSLGCCLRVRYPEYPQPGGKALRTYSPRSHFRRIARGDGSPAVDLPAGLGVAERVSHLPDQTAAVNGRGKPESDSSATYCLSVFAEADDYAPLTAKNAKNGRKAREDTSFAV
jgi:hypothetical protein